MHSVLRSVPAYLFLASLATTLITTVVAQPAASPVTVVLPFQVIVDSPSEAPSSMPKSTHWTGDVNWIGASFAQRIREELMRNGIGVALYIETRDATSELGLPYGTALSNAAAFGIARTLGANRILTGSVVLQPEPRGSTLEARLSYEARIIDLDGLARGPMFSGQGTLTDLIRLEVRASLQARAALQGAIKNDAQLTDPAFPSPEDVTAYLERLPKRRLDAEELYARGLLAIDPDTRERYWRQALSADSNFTSAAFALGQMLYRRQWYTRAAQWLEQVSPEDPRYPAALFMHGVQALEARDAESAQEIFQEMLNVAPGPEVRNNLAVAESWLDLPFAAANLRELALQYPNDPDYRFNAAYALWKTGQFAAAADGFARLLEIEDTPVARLLYERALAEYGPSDSLGDDRLEQIERIKRTVPTAVSQLQETAGQ